jgi:hypothetical protein
MVNGKSVLTAVTVGVLAGSLYAAWITVASARDQATQPVAGPARSSLASSPSATASSALAGASTR